MSTPDMSAFARYIPGFEFLQNLTRQAAAGVTPEVQSGVPGMPPMSQWVAPVFDVEELDKRIQDMKAVHFWLEQNTKALGATIQALEVQRMTLATLKGMNVSLAEMADAFKIRPNAPEQAEAPTATEAAREPGAEESSSAPKGASVDPMQWWNALTEQFQTIASDAMREMTDQATRTAEQVAQTMQAAAAQVSDPVPDTSTSAKTAAGKRAGAKATRQPAAKRATPASAKTKPRATSPAARKKPPKS
jgi:hypothetical protein